MRLFDWLNINSDVSKIIISLALMLFLGFLATRLTKLLKLPNVTAYILVGILLGPYVLDFIPSEIITKTEFLSDIALAFIAFSTGEYFRFSTLKKNGTKVILITVFESLLASILVFIVLYSIIKNLAFSIILAALAAATAPASTMMTIRQTKAKGDFVDTLLQVVALDDIVGLVAFSIAISIATVSASGEKIDFLSIISPLLINLLIIALGGFFGFFLKILMPKNRSTDNRLIILISLILLFCGICTILEVSPLLGCMSMGTIYINITNDDKLFKQLNYFSPPILLLFFVRSGLNFKLDSLFSTSKLMGSTSLIVVGVVYFIVRIVGKYLGSFIGCWIVKKDKSVRNYLGLALIPQAGVAIGLAAIGARTLSTCIGDNVGNALNTVILASSVLYELIGPACAKLSLFLSKSYSTNLDDLVVVEEEKENGVLKTEVELLIEKIKKIQDALPQNEISEEEQAYTEAAEEYLYRPGFIKNQFRKR